MENILYIDYAIQNSKKLAATLKNEGFKVEFQTEYSDAAEFLKRSSDLPDIVLCADSIKGESGIDFLRALKEGHILNKTIPVLMFSESNNKNEHLRAINAGAVDVMNKPIEANYIIAKIRAQLKVTHYNSTQSRSIYIDTSKEELRILQLIKLDFNEIKKYISAVSADNELLDNIIDKLSRYIDKKLEAEVSKAIEIEKSRTDLSA
jgi:DNA-binding response OmpR family regulator